MLKVGYQYQPTKVRFQNPHFHVGITYTHMYIQIKFNANEVFPPDIIGHNKSISF